VQRQYLGYGDVARGGVGFSRARGIYSLGREESDWRHDIGSGLGTVSQGETVRASDQLCETTDC
jgi:hypothetical protein